MSTWRDAVRGARRGLDYLDLLRDILASELTSRRYFIKGKRYGLLWLRSPNITEIDFAFWVVWPPLHVSHCSSLSMVVRPLRPLSASRKMLFVWLAEYS